MDLRPLGIEGVIEIIPKKIVDARGYFAESYARERFRNVGIARESVQDNQSYSQELGVLRGLHFRAYPFAQEKLIRVLRGSICDVAVDIRQGSPTFGSWVSCLISADAFSQLYVPKRFAHGFLTLEPDTEVFCKVSAPFAPAYDRSINFSDPTISVRWPLPISALILSDNDRNAPLLADISSDISFD